MVTNPEYYSHSIHSKDYPHMDIPVYGIDFQFNAIVESWTGHLQYVSSQITKNKQAAEDIVQEAFLLLWQRRRKIIPENPVGWLVKVVTNLSLLHLRDKHIRTRIHKNLSESLASSYSEVEEQVLKKEQIRIISRVIDQLPCQQKIVFQLSKENGLNRSQIASFLQLSPNTVKVHLSRARQFVKDNLSGILVYTMLFVFFNIFFIKSNTNSGLMYLFNEADKNNTRITKKNEMSKLSSPVLLSHVFLLVPNQSMK